MIRFFQRQNLLPLPRPETDFAAIGDIHGCSALLEKMLARIESAQGPGLPILCLGDMLDRGPDSAGVLTRLRHHADTICLMGNHERMLLDFLDMPETYGARWLRNGGEATLASYGVELPRHPVTDWADGLWQALAYSLARALGPETEEWLRGLPLRWQSGTILATHAGADPAQPPHAQSSRHLLWGHPKFTRKRRGDGLWVLHGHTVQQEVTFSDGRIGVDTGAWQSGRLSAILCTTTGTLTPLCVTSDG